jgi:hypothetical protein
MGLEESLNKSPISTRSAFTDRQGELASFGASLSALASLVEMRGALNVVGDSVMPRRNILVFHGEGGSGKTSLVDELAARFKKGEYPGAPKPTRRLQARINFDEGSTFDPETLPLRIRAGFGMSVSKWPAFDTAFTLYWAERHPGEPIREFLTSRSLKDAIVGEAELGEQMIASVDVLFGGGVGLLGTALKTGKSVAGVITGAVRKKRVMDGCPSLLEFVEETDHTERRRMYLPHLLAWDLATLQSEGRCDAVVFLDGWEDVQRLHGSPGMLGGVEDTINRLAHLMPTTLFVVSGRKQLDWYQPHAKGRVLYSGEDSWPNLAPQSGPTEPRQHHVQGLSDHDAHLYLSRRVVDESAADAPAIPPEIRAAIVDNSAGWPLYLSLSAELYQRIIRHGRTPSVGDFGGPLPEIFMRVRKDLSREENDLLRACSLVSFFDADLLRAACPEIRDAVVEDFLEHHFIRKSDKGWLPYSLHATLRTSVQEYDRAAQDRRSPREWRQMAERMLDYFEPFSSYQSLADAPRLIQIFIDTSRMSVRFGLLPDKYVLLSQRLWQLGRWDALSVPAALIDDESGDGETAATAWARVCLGKARYERDNQDEGRRLIREGMASDLLPPFAYKAALLSVGGKYEPDEAQSIKNLAAEPGPLQDDVRYAATLLYHNAGDFKGANETGTPEYRMHLLTLHGLFADAATLARTHASESEVPSDNAFRYSHAAQPLSFAADYGEALACAERGLEWAEKSELKRATYKLYSALAATKAGRAPAEEVENLLTRSAKMAAEIGKTVRAIEAMFCACVQEDPVRAQRAHNDARAAAEADQEPWVLFICEAMLSLVDQTVQPSSPASVIWLDSADAVRDRWRQAVLERRAERP